MENFSFRTTVKHSMGKQTTFAHDILTDSRTFTVELTLRGVIKGWASLSQSGRLNLKRLSLNEWMEMLTKKWMTWVELRTKQ